MKTPLAIMTVAFIGASPVWVHARSHHGHRLVDRPVARDVHPPLALHMREIAYKRVDDRISSDRQFSPASIGVGDPMPLNAANHFGRGGVATIGYQPGASRSFVEARELNAVFSSRSTAIGGVVGGNVSIHF